MLIHLELDSVLTKRYCRMICDTIGVRLFCLSVNKLKHLKVQTCLFKAGQGLRLVLRRAEHARLTGPGPKYGGSKYEQPCLGSKCRNGENIRSALCAQYGYIVVRLFIYSLTTPHMVRLIFESDLSQTGRFESEYLIATYRSSRCPISNAVNGTYTY